MNNMTLMNSFFRTTISLVVFVLCAVSAIAQDKITVTGTVLDETDTPMIGAGVQEKGTGNGVITDIDGHFSIEVAPDATLTFNYISYKSFDMDVNGRAVINVKMEPDNNILDEVVVVGYNTVKRSDLTGSVSSVGAKSLEDFKTGSVMEALGGQIAGVQITQADGTPGSSFDIKIRGVGSVNGDSSPLYIVDGFEVDNLDFISNQDILSIDVLKDASASAIYGARAANGVVLVTTKSGREGRPQITYNGSASYREISRRMDLLSPYEFVVLQVELNEERYADRYYREGVDDNGVPYRFQSIDDYLNGLRKHLPEDLPTVFISAVTGAGLNELKDVLWTTLNDESNRVLTFTHRDLDKRHRETAEDEYDLGMGDSSSEDNVDSVDREEDW